MFGFGLFKRTRVILPQEDDTLASAKDVTHSADELHKRLKWPSRAKIERETQIPPT